MMDKKNETYTTLSKERIYINVLNHIARVLKMCAVTSRKSSKIWIKRIPLHTSTITIRYLNFILSFAFLSLSPCPSRSLTLFLLTTRIKGNIFYFFGYLFISSGMCMLCVSVCFFALGQKFGFFTILWTCSSWRQRRYHLSCFCMFFRSLPVGIRFDLW